MTSKKVILDGKAVERDIKAMGITKTMFYRSIGLSEPTVTEAIKGMPVTANVEQKITRGLFKEPGYYRLVQERHSEDTSRSNDAMMTMLKQHHESIDTILDFLDDIKCTNEQMLERIKTMTTLQARLLALWEGERNDAKSENFKVPEKTA